VKIFGIGLSKTGTTSLAQALTILGYKTRDYPGLSHYSRGDLSSINPSLLEEFDALTDTPIPSFFRELDAKYPDAKFILTHRDREGWLKSCQKQFTQKLADKQNEAHNRLFTDLYDSTVFDAEKFAAGYDKFTQAVEAHFRDRPGKLLTMNVVAGDGWEKLCPFLNKPIPDVPFPKANVTRIRWMKIDDLVDTAKAAGGVLAKLHSLMLDGERTASSPFNWWIRTYLRLRGGKSFAAAHAARKAHSILVQRLSSLNPEIPILSRLSDVPAHQERSKWNHFWLIDPLDGAEGFATKSGDFSVNIALIEDQKPIYGVVHAPLSGTTYYAVGGKGGFKRNGNGQSISLDDAATANGDAGGKPTSKALTLCMTATSASAADSAMSQSMEWHSAAAQVVAQACGKHILDCRTQDEIRYNKANLTNDCIKVQ
jgi:fructose-1,6-bisphosphatase/inositol monophosphatase family enzyme